MEEFIDQFKKYNFLKFLPERIDSEVLLFTIENTGENFYPIDLYLEKGYVLFIFPMEGSCDILSEAGNEQIAVDASRFLLVAQPYSDLNLKLSYNTGFSFRFLYMSMAKLHAFLDIDLTADSESYQEAILSFRSKSIFTKKDFHGKIKLNIDKLFTSTKSDLISRVFKKGTIMELLSLYMESSMPDDNHCPHLRDEADFEKIKFAEKILIESIQTPPTIKDLAKKVGTNELKLKEGFKYIYGNTVFGYLSEYKMNMAKTMLDDSGLRVKEVADRIGYSNASHFITAFKKHFGVTPKQYLLANSK